MSPPWVRIVTLALLVALVTLCLVQPAESKRRPKLRPSKSPASVVKKNIYRIGNNKCKVCTVIKKLCFYNITSKCLAYRNGTLVHPSKNGTAYYYDKLNNKLKDADITDSADGKNRLPTRKREKRKDWHQHSNNQKLKPVKLQRSKGNYTRKRCVKTRAKYCKKVSCHMECCDKTLIDTRTSSCLITTPLECKNGGTLDGLGIRCLCPKNYLGTECQHRRCSLTCQNGGACHTRISGNMTLEDSTYNDDHCVCPADTTGKFCETKTCNLKCQNNGTCHGYRYWSMCMCPPGFSGRRCEKEIKEGDCPSRGDLLNCRYDDYRHTCFHDDACPGKKKCCRNACYHHICVDPYAANATCSYKNTTYSAGSVFYPDDCRVCTCNGSHVGSPHAVIECTRIVCPEMPKNCKNVTTPPGDCCPICNGDPSADFCAGNYKYPYFANCPDGTVVFDVDKNANTAPIKLSLHAKDCKGNALEVKFSTAVLEAGIGEENFQLVEATSSRDPRGNFAECVFNARVRDPFPPVFLTCPTDFTEMRPGAVRWELPVARDNVGLAIPPTSRHHPGDHLDTGDYMVEYWTEDYQGNIARCSFVITVANQAPSNDGVQDAFQFLDDDTDSRPAHPHHEAGHSHLTVAVCLSAIVLVVIVVGAVFVYRLKRLKKRSGLRSQQAAAPQAAPAATINAMGSVPRGNIVGLPMGLPHYSLPPDHIMSPPSYTPSDDMMACGGSPAQEAGELPSKKGPLP